MKIKAIALLSITAILIASIVLHFTKIIDLQDLWWQMSGLLGAYAIMIPALFLQLCLIFPAYTRHALVSYRCNRTKTSFFYKFTFVLSTLALLVLPIASTFIPMPCSDAVASLLCFQLLMPMIMTKVWTWAEGGKNKLILDTKTFVKIAKIIFLFLPTLAIALSISALPVLMYWNPAWASLVTHFLNTIVSPADFSLYWAIGLAVLGIVHMNWADYRYEFMIKKPNDNNNYYYENQFKENYQNGLRKNLDQFSPAFLAKENGLFHPTSIIYTINEGKLGKANGANNN